MPQRKQERRPAAGGAAADKRRQCTELPEQLMNIIGPNLVFRIVAIDDDIGGAAIAPVEDDDPVTGFGHFASESLNAAYIAPAAGRKRHPRTVITKHFIVDVDSAYV